MAKTNIADAKTITVLLPSIPSYDFVAAATALKLSLDQAGKTTTIICPDPMTVEFNRLVGVDSIVSTVGSRNLVITFPGQTDLVDKVSYNVDNGELQLIITPKSDAPFIDHHRLKFVSGSPQADLVITFGDAKLPEVYKTATPISFTALPLSQTITRFLKTNNLSLTADAASNLLSGLEKATNNYQSDIVTAETFETASLLMRAGAKRPTIYTPSEEVPGSIPSPDWFEPKIYSGNTLP